jgi:tight adherence protein C
MSQWPVLALIFTVTFAVAFLGLATLTLFRREEEPGVEPVPRVFGAFTPVIAGLLPSTEAGRESIRRDLLRAGYFEPVALINFLAIRSVMTYLPLLAGEIGAVLTDGRVSVAFFLTGVVGGLLGWALPRVALAIQADQRTDEIRRGLPMLMDTLGLTLSTGASLSSALASSGEAVRRGYPELSREVRLVLAHAQMRSLSHALDRWKDRQPIPELGSLVFLLGQADRLGTDVTRGLWELSTSLQVNARQRAEAAANRANFYMIFPTVLCLMVAAGLILAGPGIVELVDSSNRVKQIVDQEIRENEKLIKEQPWKGKKGAAPSGPPAPVPPSQ